MTPEKQKEFQTKLDELCKEFNCKFQIIQSIGIVPNEETNEDIKKDQESN